MSRKILYLSPYFWPEEIGSAPLCTELAVWLREHGNDVRVVAFKPHYPNPDQFRMWSDGTLDSEKLGDIPVCRVPVAGRGQGGFARRLANDLRFFWEVLRRAVFGEYNRTDVVVAYVPSVLTLYGAKVVRLVSGASILGVVHDIESGLASSLGLTKS